MASRLVRRRLRAWRRLRRLLRLPPERRLLLVTALAVVVGVRLALWVVPFRRWTAVLARPARRPPRPAGSLGAEEIAWAVTRASRLVPRATCLTQAVAAHVLLRRAGVSSRIVIGVAHTRRPLEAHAWVEGERGAILGEPLTGGARLLVPGL